MSYYFFRCKVSFRDTRSNMFRDHSYRELFCLKKNNFRYPGVNYLWLATQSVLGSSKDAPVEFPTGMLGKFMQINFPG